ncbi:unnamed protein product [Mycena citricolor]|uniref:MATE efflux family protein n=1 Tax=Mycena citricolor TaxID=2018698 RepID=A0AAD2HDN4_9AGAR|nr:unnamed protein product [Mycena citricolor]
MASFNGHSMASGSHPSDYDIVSRYAAAHPEHPAASAAGEILLSGEEGGHTSSTRRPSKPTMAPPSTARRSTPTEETPLLHPRSASPQIRENNDDSNDNDDDNNASGGYDMYISELKTLTKYSLPVFGTHLLEYSLIIAPVLSIGHLSTTALAGITLGSMTGSVSGFSILQGLVSALDTLLPPAWTSPQPNLVGLWSQRMGVVMAAMLIPMYCIWFNAEVILLGLKQDPEVAHLAALYLRWVSLGLPAYAFNLVSRRYFQSQGLFTVPTRIICIVAPINAALNYLLVWGPEPIRLGYIGAPIATACAFNLVCLMNIVYGVFIAPKTAWQPFSRRSFTSLGIVLNLGLAGVGQTASEWWAWELVALAAALISPAALATQSILLSSASTTYQAPFALSVATAVRIGNLLGELDAVRAKVAAHTAILMALALSLVFSTMFMVFRNRWAYLFNEDPAVVGMVAQLLPLVALFQVFDGLAGVTGGILRAKGKQMTGALLNLSAYYVIGIPFGIWLAFSWNMGLPGLWIGLTVSLVYCAFFGTLLCVRSDWNHEVDKVVKRNEAENRDKAASAEAGQIH